MAAYMERKGRWLACVRRKGFQTVRKTFSSKDAAQEWADEIERRIDMAKEGNAIPVEQISGHKKRAGVVPDEIMYLPRIDAHNGAIGIYFLFKGNECVYVGQSTQVHVRVREHRTKRNKSKDFDTYSWIPVPADKLDSLELHYIETIQPKLNSAGGELLKLKRRVDSGISSRTDRIRLNKLCRDVGLQQICNADYIKRNN